MEIHSPVAAKRLWSSLRVAFFMLRKGIVSKRKLIMEMNLKMKRGKLMEKALGNLVFNHHHARPRGQGNGLQEYEFSCDNSPNPVFFHAKRSTRHHYFPCIGVVAQDDDESEEIPRRSCSPQSSAGDSQEHPVSSSSSDRLLEEESGGVSFESDGVDNDAEEFIQRFHEQQRRQSRFALLLYELEYQEMLARGR